MALLLAGCLLLLPLAAEAFSKDPYKVRISLATRLAAVSSIANRDYMQVLGVGRDADDAAIKKAYKVLAL
ncbi:hypothetical protein TSOC_015467, partial [Tetrabaena socialis]